jgi:hypothetical protein
MKTFQYLLTLAIASFTLAACGSNGEQQVESAADKAEAATAAKAEQRDEGLATKAGSPFRFQYSVIGTPIVGSPVAVDLKIFSSLGAVPVDLEYRITDPSALVLHELQPAQLRKEMAANDEFISERVTVIPQRDGRIYLNIHASVEVEGGSRTQSIAIPLAVGPVSTELVQTGELQTDPETGERISVGTED